jgi:zinc and cadmium transporter
MHLSANLLLFVVTFVGGAFPLFLKAPDDRRMHLLLAFSGSFLFGITCLHLLPETFGELRERAGLFVLAGFFLQLLIQRATHGVEHGHTHVHGDGHGHGHGLPAISIIAGLSIHAFMEGLPLGFNYHSGATNPSLFLAVGAHKLPEAILLGILLKTVFKRGQTLAIVTGFAMITPISAILATYLGVRYFFISRAVTSMIPLVAGAFIHISTTIFFESGTRQHMLTWQKVSAMIAGAALAALTLFLE